MTQLKNRRFTEVVNEATRVALEENADDLAAFVKRRGEPLLSFDEVVEDMKRRGRLPRRPPEAGL